ncbi:MAG: UDP-galactopyranose mutase [Promethearchaeota archaeon]
MRILIIGAGLTGCTFATLLNDKGYKVSINEKQDHIGGLCYTKTSPNGILYEPYGGHAFHTNYNKVKKFVLRFSEFNSYKHNKGIIINGVLRHFPLSKNTILKMNSNKLILKEIEERPKIPDLTNFETYAISRFGKSLYKLFIYNYSKRMWGLEPRELSTEYIRNRIELNETETHIFKDNFQGLPVKGYTKFLNNMIKDIPLELNTSKFNLREFDLVLFSGRIDELLNFQYGKLNFRSLRFEYKMNENWENEEYGSINLPQHHKYIRKVNFKVMYQQKTKNTWIQYQEPMPYNNSSAPLYPIYTQQNINLFNKYLIEACKSDKIIPIGRLGLYKYLEMGQAISLSMNMLPLIEKWKKLNSSKRYHEIKELLYSS